jgi:hypothetical protein
MSVIPSEVEEPRGEIYMMIPRDPSPFAQDDDSFIRHSCFVIWGPSPISPPLSWIRHRGQTFAELRLLAFGFPLLIRLAHLLFGARTRSTTPRQH